MRIDEAKLYFFNSLKNFYTENELKSLFKFVFEYILNSDFAYIIANPDKKINITELKKIIYRLQKYEPYQYILGETEFYNLKFKLDKNVLIPRPETEELVDLIITENKRKKNLNILDIGTGSGCIIISLYKNLDCKTCKAIDVSDKAINIAKINAKNNLSEIQFVKTDILKASNKLFKHKFDIIVSNPPYVTNTQKKIMQKNVLNYEPQQALFVDDNNPLIFYKKIANLAKKILKQNGKLFFEINELFGNETHKILNKYGYNDIKIIKDFNNKDRFVSAIKKQNTDFIK